MHFDKNAEFYNQVRPGYQKELYSIIEMEKQFNQDSLLLELGAGNGIASSEINEKWKSKLILIEPGKTFCDLLIDKFRCNRKIQIEQTTFEDYQIDEKFDGIFSATAFHWLDKRIKYKKAAELLKDDGLLVLYWNYYSIEEEFIEKAIENIYQKYWGIPTRKLTSAERINEKILQRRQEINESSYFEVVRHQIFTSNYHFNSEMYIKLLRTFPDHENLTSEFFTEVAEVICKNQNQIKVKITTNLEVARKRKLTLGK